MTASHGCPIGLASKKNERGDKRGWRLERLYMTNYTNTLVPCLNLRFGFHYGRCFDDTIDLAFERVRVNRKLLLSPRSFFFAFFGYFFPPESDVTAVFRMPG